MIYVIFAGFEAPRGAQAGRRGRQPTKSPVPGRARKSAWRNGRKPPILRDFFAGLRVKIADLCEFCQCFPN